MAQRQRLTNNSDETDIAALISGDTIFSIPYFQRPYKWKPARLAQLNADILSLVDESTDVHFLGAVIVHGRRSNPSDPDVFDVIDGQQRIITLFLYLCATVKTLINCGEYSEAAAIFLKYLVINRDTGSLSNLKIHACKEDRFQMNNVYRNLLEDPDFKDLLGNFKLKALPTSGGTNGVLWRNYRSALKFFKDELDQEDIDRVRTIYSAILNQMSVVQIDVWDPTNGPKIFDSLNSRQEPMTIGDLVRNEVFSRIANEHPNEIERIDAAHWQPFYQKFEANGKNLFDRYFFPYGLVNRPNLKKSDVYNSLRSDWVGINDPQKIIDQLGEYQDAFIDLQFGSNLCDHAKPLALAFKRLHSTNLPSSTFPFLMQLSNAASQGDVTEIDAIGILSVVESFLVRRATCGHEPTGLHAVFKRLWHDCAGVYSAERVSQVISGHRTVAWPSTTAFRDAIASRNLYGVGVTRFLILEYDKSLKGDDPQTVPWIEHVLPEKPHQDWFDVFSKEQHAMFKDRLANLLPLSSEMNASVSNKSYDVKRQRFLDDSMFKSARQFAAQVEHWTPEELEHRGAALADWAASRWPHEQPLHLPGQ